MIRLALVALLALSGCATAGAQSAAVVLYREDGARCGGVMLTPHVALTASHCVQHRVGERVHLMPLMPLVWGKYWAESVATYQLNDLALVALRDGRDIPHAPHAARQGVKGERVFAIAPAYGWARSEGVLLQRTFEGSRMATYWETTITVAPGWSGSPVFAESDSALIGVVSTCSGTTQLAGDHVEKTCSPDFSVVAGFTLEF
jgi:hypothetical protein